MENKLLIINGDVFSTKIFEFYESKGKIHTGELPDVEIPCWMEEFTKRKNFNEFTLNELWGIVHKLLLAFAGIEYSSTNNTLTPDELKEMLVNVEDTIMYFVFAEELSEDVVDNIDPQFIETINKKADEYDDDEEGTIVYKVNHRFNAHMYFKIMILRKNLENYTVLYNKHAHKFDYEDADDLLFESRNTKMKKSKLVYAKKLIDDSCREIMVEFIEGVIEYIQTNSLHEYHQELARVIGYNNSQIPDFKTVLPPDEIWNRCFPFIFDDTDDSFEQFFAKYTEHCILYVFHDYLDDDMGYTFIPFINIVVDKEKLVYNIVNDIDEIQVEKRLKDLYE